MGHHKNGAVTYFAMSSLVLASASPQRKRLLEGIGLDFLVHPSDFDEVAEPETNPAKRSIVLSQKKAEAVRSQFPDSFIIGCDTLVVSAEGETLEKAPNADAARVMVQKLSGKPCIVHSGLSVINPSGATFSDISSSTVTFKTLTEQELDWWIASDIWKDRSGSFQIDGHGQLLISNIEGDWSSIVGLPVFLLGQLLSKAGFDVFAHQS